MAEHQLIVGKDAEFLQDMEAKGRAIYCENPHYRSLANVMENPDFQEFYEKYFHDPQMLRVILSFMRTYDEIGKQTDLRPYQKLALLKEIFTHGQTRRLALRESHDKLLIQRENVEDLLE